MRLEDAPQIEREERIAEFLPATESVASPAYQADPWDREGRRSLAISERRILLIVMDVGLLLLLGYGLSWDHAGPGNFPGLALLFALPWLVIGQISGLYDLATSARTRQCLRALGITSAAFALSLVLTWYIHPYLASRPKLLVLAIAGPVLIGLWRLAYIRLLGAAHFERRVLVVGAGTTSRELLQAVRRHHGHGIAIVGVLDDDPSKIGKVVEGIPVVGDSSTMWPLVSDLKVEEVVLALNRPSNDALFQALGTCYERGVAVSLMPQLYEEVTGQVPVEFMGPHWFGSVQLGRTGGGMSFALKRLMDIGLGTIALVLMLPAIAVISALVKLTSSGPILHKQQRIGLHGRPFKIVKFRTMRVDAEKPGQALWAEAVDPRATSIGRWLRRTHLDELPQLFLVVRGEMSLVGPRPERPEFVEELERTIPLYRARYSMRPGIAGWAQLNYPYGASVEDALAKLRYDLYYVKNWSCALDTGILLRTVAVLDLSPRNTMAFVRRMPPRALVFLEQHLSRH